MKKETKKERTEKVAITTVLKESITAPIDNIEKNVLKLTDIKSSALFAGILALTAMVLNLLTNMITSVFVKTCDFWTGKCKTTVTFDKLNNLDYIDLVFKELIKYALVIFAIGGVYYIASLIVKKSSTYFKSLAITSAVLIPTIVATLFMGPVLGLLDSSFEVFVTVLGNAYTILVLAMVIKKEFKVDDDKLILSTALVVLAMYIVYHIAATATFFA